MNKLSKMGDPLERLKGVINWEMFRSILQKSVVRRGPRKKEDAPYDVVLMLKILVLQRLYNISDYQTEYQIYERLSFKRFLGLVIGGPVPDAKTI